MSRNLNREIKKLTVNMYVSNSGGSINLTTDSTNTKKAITIRKSPLINPERISIRPYLKMQDIFLEKGNGNDFKNINIIYK